MIFTLLVLTLLGYFIYTRVVELLLSRWYYESIGIKFASSFKPVIGDFVGIGKFMKANKDRRAIQGYL
jgi:hypothetical protein